MLKTIAKNININYKNKLAYMIAVWESKEEK